MINTDPVTQHIRENRDLNEIFSMQHEDLSPWFTDEHVSKLQHRLFFFYECAIILYYIKKEVIEQVLV